MPRFFGRLQGLKIDAPRYTKDLERRCESLVKNAAREFVRAMIVKVPVWTGMARGSIKFASGPRGNLSRFLNVAIPISPIAYKRGKTPEAGGRQAHYNFTTSNHVFRFTFRSDVRHYIHNEFFARTDPGAGNQQVQAPWHSLEVGASAFNNYIRANIGSIPKVHDYIVKVPIPFGK